MPLHAKSASTVLLFLSASRWMTTAQVSKLSGLKRCATLIGLWALVGLYLVQVRTASPNHGTYYWKKIGDLYTL